LLEKYSYNKTINPMLSNDEFNVNKWLRKKILNLGRNINAGAKPALQIKFYNN